jgi:U3 small nucleolar RNA-associated protein 14
MLVVVSKDSKALDKAKHRLDKQASKSQDERAKALDDAALQISLDKVLRLPVRPPESVQQDEDESGGESEIEAQENNLLIGKRKGMANVLAFQQRDLVALAFAGDNVVSVCDQVHESYHSSVIDFLYSEF